MYAEPLDLWRRWARKFRAILQLAARLGEGERGTPELWADAAWMPHAPLRLPEDLPPDVPVIRPPGFDPDYEQDSLEILSTSALQQAAKLGHFVGGLAATTGISPSVRWRKESRGGQYDVVLGSPRTANLFGSLMMALVAVLSSKGGPYRCTVCGETASPESEGRRPRGDRSRFCGDECRDQHRLRVKRESERRRRKARSQTQPSGSQTR